MIACSPNANCTIALAGTEFAIHKNHSKLIGRDSDLQDTVHMYLIRTYVQICVHEFKSNVRSYPANFEFGLTLHTCSSFLKCHNHP